MSSSLLVSVTWIGSRPLLLAATVFSLRVGDVWEVIKAGAGAPRIKAGAGAGAPRINARTRALINLNSCYSDIHMYGYV